ncbi:hypothetical protein [Limnohabitans sp. DM1]|uniref:hypothetical protein n=1 Tax=Limnohabitans sp. DM1 TaxID=1597955 RepID=UPI000A4EA070|nr:hypothetical protein [Limnohabitans sp. DM1]
MTKQLILVGLIAWVMGGTSLAAAPSDNFTATAGAVPEKAKKAKKARAPKPQKDKGYGENKAERDKRLLRECRGKPNAGACEGYAG